MSVSRVGLSVVGPDFLRSPGRFSTYCLTDRLTYLRKSSDRCDIPRTSGPGCRSLTEVEGPYALGAVHGAFAARGASAARLLRVISCQQRVSSMLHRNA